MIGKVKITETIMPGVTNFILSFGHVATRAADLNINGQLIKGDPRRAAGFHANAAMGIDLWFIPGPPPGLLGEPRFGYKKSVHAWKLLLTFTFQKQ